MAEEDERERAPRPRLAAFRDFLLGPPGDSTPARTDGPAPGSASEPSASMPERIGPYRILRKLGQGGMGVVYAARDERLDRTLAIKTILGLATDETARKRFWREAKAAASVNHPNVCQLYEIGEEGGALFIAMELLDGESLCERLEGRSLPRGRGGAHRPRGARRARGPPRARHRAPRSQALERLSHPARREAARLRPGPARRRARHRERHLPDRPHPAGRDRGHAALHGPGAGHRRGGGCPHRPLCLRRHPLRDAGGAARVRRQDRGGGALRHPARAAAGALGLARGGGRGPGHPPGAGQGAEGPLPHGRGHGGRPPGDPPGRRHRRRRAGPGPHPPRGPALPGAPARSRYRLPGLQPARRHLARRSRACPRWWCAPARPRPGSPPARPTSRRIAAEADVDRVLTGTLLRSGDQLRVTTQLVEAPGGHPRRLAHRAGRRSATSSPCRTT